ncbi:MAG: class I SAM-dependent methyltransferase [Armatimonadota bacterium]|nr:class I SAM-dependent methyltransferase [Armatimonadota bacterium]
MTIEIADDLLSMPGRALLAEAEALLTARAKTLTALTRLRKTASPELAVAAWEMAELRRRGQVKFGPKASEMYFVREALEQASGLGTADYHAARMAAAGATTIADLGGGIGGDALAFARAGLSVTLYERDPIRARFAEENASVWGFTAQISVAQADVTTAEIATNAAWLDPARRRDSRRVSDPEDYSPPLSWLTKFSERGIASIGVKLSPAIDHSLADRFDAELEFLSEGGECREALLWLGTARSGDKLRATVISANGPVSLTGEADTGRQQTASEGRYLYEPDPAVIRAHLVGTLARQMDAAPMDPQIAYLLGDRLTHTPFADAYEILERFPYGKKRLQEALTAHDIGRVIIKKRGFPQEPDEIRKQLKLRGSQEMIVVLARIGTGHETFLCRLV